MATILLGNKNNILTATFDTVAKTLTIANCTAFDLTLNDLEYVYSTTASEEIQSATVQNCISCTRAWVAGMPVFIYTFSTLPAGVANTDTLLIYLQVPQVFMDFLQLQVIAAATI